MVQADENSRLRHRFGERVKELTALHRTARILQDHMRPSDALMKGVLELLPRAWQYPEITRARIHFREIDVRSDDFRRTDRMQSASFSTQDGSHGGIDICYVEERPTAEEGPFLSEERDLIDSLGEMLRSHFQQVTAVEELWKDHDQLEAQVRIRTRQLEEANRSLQEQVEEHQRAKEKVDGYQRRLRRLATELSLSEARQRREIAQELHDHIGQALAFTRLRVTRFHGDAVFCGFNGGADFSDFSDWDGEEGPGAHTLEVGGSFTLGGSFPLTFSGFMNIHNDEGHNTYFQVDCPVDLGETSLNLFAGATSGSDKNPDYYGAESFEFINLGLTAGKEIPISSRFSLPVSASWILNPNQDISYLVVGFSF